MIRKYKIVGFIPTLKKAVLFFLSCLFFLNGFSQTRTISGKVTNKKGDNLPGVTVRLKGSTTGVVTDPLGNYNIGIPGNNEGTLSFSYLGYITQEIPVGNKSILNATLEESLSRIDSIVVVGYGTQKRINLTGAVATISGTELQHVPTNNLTNAIGGRLAGVVTVQGNGRPGLGSSVNIRGLSTLNNNNPLVVVDGIVRSDGFGNIDPNAVESISILKDASAAAVYGARAANGVILITTKRGKIGKPTITYTGTVGLQQPTEYPRLMSAFEYANTRNHALLNQGYDPSNPAQANSFYSEEDLKRFKAGIGVTDWYKATFKKNSLMTKHDISVNGGTEAIRYFMSLGYLSQDAMYDNFNFRRYNFRTNIDTRITKNLNIGLNVDARQELYNYPGWDANTIFSDVVRQRPTIPAFHPDGKPFNTNGEHPVEMIHSSGYNKNVYNIFQGTVFFEQKLPFVKGLSLKGTASYYKEHRFDKIFFTPYTMYDEDSSGNITNTKVVGEQTYLREFFTEINNVTLNLSLNYMRTFNKHDISGLLLVEQYGSTGNTFDARKQDFATNIKDELFASGPANQTITGNGIINDLRRSLVGRLNYAYASKYLIEATFRYDGSYRFPKDKRFGFFPAFSAGWRISEEPFFKTSKASDFVNSLKIRVSKGLIGNDQVDAFQFLDSYGITTNMGPIIGGQAQPYVTYGVYPNQDITWEKQDNNDIGLDAFFLNSKLGLVFDYFFRTTKDILWSKERSVPGTFGRSLPDENYAEVKSRGFDFSLTYQNNIQSFEYNFRLTGSYATNKVTMIDDPSNALDFQKQLGRPIGFIVGYRALGIFQNQKDADDWFGGHQFNQKTLAGDIKYADVNGDGEITLQDQEVLSNYSNTPRVMFGLSGGFNYKKFDMSFLVQGAAQRNLLLSGSGRIMYRGGGSNNNFAYLADSWSADNTDAKYPLAWVDSRSMNDRNSSLWLKKAGYARLKSVSIGYRFDLGRLKREDIQQLRVYVSGFNLFTVSQIKEFDPEAEVGTGSYYPQQRSFNFGLTLSF